MGMLKALVYVFIEGPHPTVPSVKMADALVTYKSKYKFQFKFNLKVENNELQ